MKTALPAALTLSILAHLTQAQGQYSVTVIDPFPGHSSVTTNAINNRGEVVGVSYGSPIDNQGPYVYRPGQGVQALPFPPGMAFSVPTDINDDGAIVGYAQPTWSDEQSMVAWKYVNGQFTMFPAVSYAHNINNPGAVVGRSCLSGTGLTCYFDAQPGGPMQTIAAADFYLSSQYRLIDINDNGQVLYTPPSAVGAATLRQSDGTLVSLPAPPAPFVRTYTQAVNNAGQAVARWDRNVGSQYYSRAFLWSVEAGAIEIGIPNNHVRPKGLNNLGHVVGESGGNQNSYLDMWIWTPERGSQNLEPMVDPALQLILTGVSGINDRGQIIARGISQLPPAPTLAFILTPPSSCGTSDFNGDGDTGTDADIEAFFACIAGSCCATCGSADFNADGDVATDADIESFFRVLAGGPC
jgi:uncharacterized membrane protein